VTIVGITNVQQKILNVCFEDYIISGYASTNDPGSGFKCIHYDLVDALGFLTITLIVGSNFVFIFSPCLNVGSFIWVLNFGVTFRNNFERGNWEFVLRVGTIIVIKQIDLFGVCLHFVPTRSILEFMQKENLKELGTMELMVTWI
jgi:hypothetical protein